MHMVRTFGFVSAVALLSQAVGTRAAEITRPDGMELVEALLACAGATYREDDAWETWNGTNCMYGASKMEDWDTSNVTDFSVYKYRYSASDNSKSMFSNAIAFNGNISGWNTSAAKSTFKMFKADPTKGAFNADISAWDVSHVTDMAYMFKYQAAFNQDLGDWDVGRVEDMEQMFGNTDAFNQDLSDWNVSAATSLRSMFTNALAFSQNLSSWDVAETCDVTNMFRDSKFGDDYPVCESFNQRPNVCQAYVAPTAAPTPEQTTAAPTTGPGALPTTAPESDGTVVGVATASAGLLLLGSLF